MRRLLIILIAYVLIRVPVAGTAAADQKVALVIGNSAYTDAPLKNPAHDAIDMASALKNLGFEVTLKTDANQRAMEESIRAFGNKLQSGGVGLFYYAGHGIQYRGTNYLIPVHADIKTEADVKYRSVDAGYVLAQMETAGNNLNIIILDACRNNPYARSFRSADRGLVKMDNPAGSILAYATAPGSVAADGKGKNGLYTEKLLKYMQTPGITVERMLKLVRRDVTKASGKKQVPWVASSLIGDFYFVPSRGISVQEKPPKQKTPALVASIAPTMQEPKIIQDGQYIKYPTGIVYDSSTGLEWYAGPAQSLPWEKANYWAKSLWIGGGNWRLPTLKELRSLYRDGLGLHNMTSLINASGGWFWSGETRLLSNYRWYFSFITGEEGVAKRPSNYAHRMLAVRKRK